MAKKSKKSKKEETKKKRKSRKKKQFQSPKGMSDILPQDQPYWNEVRERVSEIANFYNFLRIDTPILENAGLFEKSVGEATDIVEKQMYTLTTRGGDKLVMRPEGTAAIMRAYIEHGLFSLGSPTKLFYVGPMFRHESAQKWRSRQFYQAGFEIMGSDDGVYDAQIILVLTKILELLRVKEITIQINSIGCKECRGGYRTKLKNYYKSHVKKLCKDCQRRYEKNPLRLLDCKEEKDVKIKEAAPLLLDELCKDCHDHFKKVLEFLDTLKLPYQLQPHLVRGLDYYNRTVFEIIPAPVSADVVPASQNALASGGRFDYLAKMLGGKDTPAVGAAMGIDRIIEYVRDEELLDLETEEPDVYVVQLGELARRKALLLMEELRGSKINAAESLGRDSIKAQLRVADKVGADFSLIIGQKEAHEDNVIIRDMYSGSQETIPSEKIVSTIKKKLKKSRKRKKKRKKKKSKTKSGKGKKKSSKKKSKTKSKKKKKSKKKSKKKK